MLDKKLQSIRTAVADYMRTEGCSCCRDIEGHKEAERILAGLLEVPMYNDGSGYQFYKFGSDAELIEKLEKFHNPPQTK